jgi:hypothetical protein
MKYLLALPLLALGLLAAEPQMLVQVDFRQKADRAAWEVKGDAAFEAGGFHTRSVPDAKDHASGVRKDICPLPTGMEGTLLRVAWTFVPTKIGGWGSDIRALNGPFVVEVTGTKPTLNARYPAKTAIAEGKPCTMTCDVTRNLVVSWTINGVEQLREAVPAWHLGATKLTLGLYDFRDTKSETVWQKITVSEVRPADPLLLKVAAWDDQTDIEPDQPSPFLLGQASPMTKVFREAADFSGTFSRRVELGAAGRERESFQLVVMPLGKPLRNVRVAVGDLLHDDRQTRFPNGRISWHPIGYVRTKPSRSAIRRVGWQWPDVLMPAQPFGVELGFVQPVWFTVDVPHGTKPGRYRGFVRIEADGVPAQSVGVELTVRPFSLPLRGKLKTAFCICAGMWEIWYRPDEVKKRLGMTDKSGHGALYTSPECADVLPHEKWLEMYDFLLAHRLSPTTIYSGLKKGRARVVPAREDMQYCYDRGMNATCLVCIGGLSKDPEKAKQYLADLDAYLKDWEGFVKEKNWPDFTWYLHSFDESEMRPKQRDYYDYAIATTMDHVGEAFPWLKRETANPFIERHDSRFDIWTPVTPQLSPDKIVSYRAAQKRGDEAWAYVCCGPGKPYANFFIDFPGVDPRILGWQFYQHKLTGFLYYLINHYQPNENWNMNGPKWPDRPWNPLSFNTNSDGILIYPGPDATPLASIRLENLRDGIEDYEALAMLADAAAKLRATGGNPELLADADALLKVPPQVSASWKDYTHDPATIVAARHRVDELLAKMLASPSKSAK